MRSLRRNIAAAVLAAAFACTGCATINPSIDLADAMPPGSPGAVRLDAPFHPQTEYQCGPAALAGLLGESGVDTHPDALAPRVYLPGRRGSLQLELVGATRRAGRIPFEVEATPDALLAELQAGRPVLVLQNLLTRTVPKWHYAVLVGADPARNRMLLNSGTTEGLEVKAPSFLRTWDWAGRWGLVALRPGELPARATPAGYLSAVADFEAVAGADAAAPAYAAALRRWPREPRVHLALGNQAHARGDVAAAARHFRDGLGFSPGDPVLGNNYASVLGELGCPARARRIIADTLAATPVDGRWRGSLEATARELEDAPPQPGVDCDGL
ncbi:PA2778 family cysteine peptidase [Luteimonas pelagia]